MTDKMPNVDSLFMAALEIDSPEQRMTFLRQSCGDHKELLAELTEMLSAQGELGSFLEQLAPGLEDTFVSDASGKDRAASLDAGLALSFDREAAVVIGDANHSVLRSLGNTLNEVPRISLRESNAEGADPITRPNSPEVPKSDPDSRYQLQGEIARGGMGAIIKGRDTDLGRDLAIKVLLDSHKDKPEVVQRFVEEAQIGGQLQHPGIAPIYELGQFADKRPFFAMKLVKGQTLSKLLKERVDAAEDRGKLIGIFEQICQTMAYAHSRGVIHRDLKPANIMVGAFGEVQVMDWGLAKVLLAGGIEDEKQAHSHHKDVSIIQTMRSVGSSAPGTFGSVGSETQMGSVMGTPAYMPPEQALGEIDQMDERADVFGLGAILCEILTGKPPYVADDGTHVFRMASRGKLADCFARLEACQADQDLISLTKHCLELEPKDRPRDVGVLAEKVTGYLESVEDKLRETELQRVAESTRAVEARKRMRVTMALAASVLLMLSLGGGSWVWMAQQAAARREVATNKTNSALRDAQVHQSLSETVELDVKIREIDKAVAFARTGMELSEQESVGTPLRSRAKKLLTDLQTQAASIRQIAEQARKDHAFRMELELIRLSQADSETLQIAMGTHNAGPDDPTDDNANGRDVSQTSYSGPNSNVISLFNIASSSDRYSKAFQDAGFDLSALNVAQATVLVRSSNIRDSLIAAIDNWARAIPRSKPAATASTKTLNADIDESSVWRGENNPSPVSSEKLLTIANAADDSRWRRDARAALASGDIAKLERLAAAEEAHTQSPELTAWVGAALRDGNKTKASVALLLPARRKSPDDFWLNYELGKSFAKDGSHLEGLGFIRAAVSLRPESTGAQLALASSSSRAGRHEHAATIYQTIIARHPGLIDAHMGLATALLKQGDAPRAVAAFQHAIKLEPTNASLRYNAGVAFRKEGRLREAIAKYREAIELDPRAEFHTQLADDCAMLADALDDNTLRAQAVHAFEEALSSSSESSGSGDWRQIRRWKLLRDMGKTEQVHEEMQKAIERDPDSFEVHRTRVAILREQGRYPEAIKAIRKCIELNPGSFVFHHVLASTLMQQGRPAEAEVAWRKSIQLAPDYAWSNVELGSALVKRGKINEAITLIKKGVELHPGRSSFHLKLGDAYYAQSDLTKAINAYRTASRLLPESEEMHAPLVRSLEEIGGLDAVIAEYRDAISRNPSSSINHVRLGKKLREQGNREEARVAFERAIDLKPDHSIAPYVQLALLHGQQGQGKGDVGVRMILDRYPNSHLAYDYAARSLVAEPATTEHQPNYEHAVQWARRACDLKPDEGRYWNTLGIALYRQGKWREAADTIEESQKRAESKILSNSMLLTMASWNLGEKERARIAFRAISANALAGSNQEQHGFFIELQHLLGREGLEFLAFAGEDSEIAAGALAKFLTQQWSSQNWPSLSVQLGHENEADGINLVADPGDGLTEPRFIEGQECRVILKTMAVGHAYFSIDSEWKSAAGMDAEVTIEYWDDGSGSFALQYDAYEHAYRPCSKKIAIGGSRTWRKATFQLNNARFANSQNGRADFRLATPGNGLHVRRVSLQRIQPATEPGDSWGKLAAAYHLMGDKTALARLLKDHPLAEVSLGDSYLENQN